MPAVTGPGRAPDRPVPYPEGLPPVFPTVVHMLSDAAAQAPEQLAVISEDDRLTYAGYLRCVAGFAQELLALGADGSRVATLLGNSLDAAIASFAVHAARAQLVPLNPLYRASELEPLLRDAEPLILITESTLDDWVPTLANRLGIRHLLVIGGAARPSLSVWRDDAAQLLPTPLPDPDAPATLQYTGGTTGRSKGAILVHGRVALNIAQREALLPTRKDQERILCIAPLCHVFAVAMGLHLAAYCRGALIIQRQFKPEATLALAARERPTILVSAPPVYIALMAHPRFRETDLSSLRVCYSGASALSDEVLRRWQEATGCPILEGFGQSESGPVVAFNPEAGVRKAGSVGIPTPGTAIQIVDADRPTWVLGTGEVGEIRIAGPQLMIGYHNRPEETATALRDGWLYTGDIGEIDADGYLFIRDRKKDMINCGGFNVYPREVEEVLYRHPDVLEAAVIGVADDFRGEAVLAFIVPRRGAAVTPDTLQAHCRDHLAKYKIPASIRLLEEMPKTAVGKIDKSRLRQSP